MFKKIIVLISLFSFSLTPLVTAQSEHAHILIKRHQQQAEQLEKINNSFITQIDNQAYFFPKDLNIVTLGDSLTQGVGDESKNSGYVGLIDDFLDNKITINNFGISGYRSDQLIKLIEDSDVQAGISEADLALITIGANDLMKIFKNELTNLEIDPFLDELAEFETRLTDIFIKLHELNPNMKIYLIGFYDPFSEYFPEVEELTYISSSWNAGSAIITNKFDYAYYIPTNKLFEKNVAAYLAEDKFHPNQKGYTKIAQEVIEQIKTGVDDVYETK